MPDRAGRDRPARAVRGNVLLLTVLSLVSLAPVLVLVLTAWQPPARYPSLWAEAARGNADGNVWTTILQNTTLGRAMLTSLLLALLTGLTATGIGFVAARTIARISVRARRLIAAAAFLPVIAPPLALGIGVQVFTLRLGLGGSVTGVLLSHIVPAAGYLTLFLLGALTAYDSRMEDEARSLGARPWQVLLRITLPALRGPIVQAIALGALVSWGQVALTLIVGGGIVRTLPVELLAFVRAGDDRLGAAAAILLTVPPLLAFGLVQAGARRTGVGA